MTTLTLADLPTTDARPQRSSKSPTRRRLVRSAFDRRTMLKGTFVAMSASALSSVDGLLKLSRANADVPPTWYHCDAYVGDPNWDNGYWTQCNPYANDVDGNPVEIGSGFCGDINYHRIDQVIIGYDEQGRRLVKDYERRPNSCKNKNAWVWHVSDNPNPPNPSDKRCSDGKYRINAGSQLGGWHYSVCKYLL